MYRQSAHFFGERVYFFIKRAVNVIFHQTAGFQAKVS
jgi:hypothetical protein